MFDPAHEIRKPLTLPQVAAALDMPLRVLHRKIARLRRDHGFPKPLPVIGGYDPLAIAAWQNRFMPGAQARQPSGIEVEVVVDIEDARRRMDERARRGFVP